MEVQCPILALLRSSVEVYKEESRVGVSKCGILG